MKKEKGLSFDKDDTIEIAKTYNGYALKTYFVEDVDEKGEEIIQSDIQLFEMDEGKNDEKECLKQLLYAVASALGFDYDKWKEDNL